MVALTDLPQWSRHAWRIRRAEEAAFNATRPG